MKYYGLRDIVWAPFRASGDLQCCKLGTDIFICGIFPLQQAQYEAKLAEERERHESAEAEIEEVRNYW